LSSDKEDEFFDAFDNLEELKEDWTVKSPKKKTVPTISTQDT